MREEPALSEKTIASSDGLLKLPLYQTLCHHLLMSPYEMRLADCPAHFFFVVPANELDDPAWLRTWQGAAGRGFTAKHAQKAAICEAVERACLQTSGENDPRLSNRRACCHRHLSTLRWLQYNATQLKVLSLGAQYPAIFDCYSPVDKLWITGWDVVRGCPVDVSATTAMFAEDRRIGLPTVFSSSSGTAVRDTLAGAAEHAVLELVERDGVAIWWYNRLRPSRLAPDFAAAVLPTEMADWIAARRRQTRYLLLPSDLPVATIVALSARADGSRLAIGAAAALDPADAVRSATLELLQCELTLANMRAYAQMPDAPPPPPLYLWSQATMLDADPEFGVNAPFAEPPAPISYPALIEHFAAAGIDLVTVDLTRPELRIPVVRALSPQLRDWLPRFGPGRLYDVPVALGLRDTPTPEAELNPTPFVI